RIRDAAVPVNKWPDVGATLPVRVAPGNARKVTILWDEVRTHREAAYDDHMYPGFATLSDEERAQAATEDVEFDHGPLPPDDRPTVTDLPLVEDDAVVEEVAVGTEDVAIGEPVLVSDRATSVPAPRTPEAAANPIPVNPVAAASPMGSPGPTRRKPS